MKTKLLSETDYFAEMEEVCARLNAVRQEGTFCRVPDQPIYYELYPVTDGKGWVALSHGFTESTVKYMELIWYLAEEGYSVAICDHRGHGNSVRQVKKLWLTHVERFDDYCEDYAYFLKTVIVPRLEGQPLFILGHSMGGAIAVLTTELHPELPIEKLILSSPMIAPQRQGFPKWLTLLITRFFTRTGRGHHCLFNQQVSIGEDDFDSDWCCTNSYPRYCWYLNVQKQNPQYQNNAATYRWTEEAVLVTDEILKPENLENLNVPILLLQAGKDTMVCNDKQDEFIQKVKNGRIISFPTTKHELFRSDNATMRKYLDIVLNFMQE
jgi:lysophospholipase